MLHTEPEADVGLLADDLRDPVVSDRPPPQEYFFVLLLLVSFYV